jgi:hypothetical protein
MPKVREGRTFKVNSKYRLMRTYLVYGPDNRIRCIQKEAGCTDDAGMI